MRYECLAVAPRGGAQLVADEHVPLSSEQALKPQRVISLLERQLGRAPWVVLLLWVPSGFVIHPLRVGSLTPLRWFLASRLLSVVAACPLRRGPWVRVGRLPQLRLLMLLAV